MCRSSLSAPFRYLALRAQTIRASALSDCLFIVRVVGSCSPVTYGVCDPYGLSGAVGAKTDERVTLMDGCMDGWVDREGEGGLNE